MECYLNVLIPLQGTATIVVKLLRRRRLRALVYFLR
ncbi:hypothetical protein GGR30_004424 [Martelella radicis]|uniref:Uncharacterized protein n=1 Tax=Martelella radicis TaxID=1397476 RepID=A0A7W6PCE6_9HYPH|nr:hypothetical protein [Martelella radicis]